MPTLTTEKRREITASIASKGDEADAILKKAAPTAADVESAERLLAQADALMGTLEADAPDRALALKGWSDDIRRRRTEPDPDGLPIGGGRMNGGRTKGHDGSSGGYRVKGRIEPWESEIDRKQMTGGFPSAGHFYKAVHLQCVGQLDRGGDLGRYMKSWDEVRTKSDAMSSIDEPSAGVLVPEGFALGIEKRMDQTKNLMLRCRSTPIGGSSMTFFRRQDGSRADGSRHAGVTVKYEGEGDTLDKSKAKFEKYRIEAHKCAALVEVTEELITDSPTALENEINDLGAEALVFKASDKMVRGNGVGMPLGILNSNHRVTVSKEPGQAAASITRDNILQMWMRLDPDCRANAIWMMNNDCQAGLDAMEWPVGTGGVPAYMPDGGLSAPGYTTLKGRPVVPMEYCETLGTEGDIILTDWEFYRGVMKEGIRAQSSLHVYFERDSRCFRFVLRFGGEPMWNVPWTPYKGTVTTSSIVTLETRA